MGALNKIVGEWLRSQLRTRPSHKWRPGIVFPSVRDHPPIPDRIRKQALETIRRARERTMD